MSCLLLTLLPLWGAAETVGDIAQQIQQMNPAVLAANDAARIAVDDTRTRRIEANLRSTRQWNETRSKESWEKFRSEQLRFLQDATGFVPVDKARRTTTETTGTLEGRGFRIDNLLFQSRTGMVVTANLYLPLKPAKLMPGIVLAHSHHNPKSESELQEMGIGWARQGCAVIVPDLLGHGERRQHPFRTAADFAGSFRPGRQDYYFRYVTGMQLSLMGKSLCGWLATDLSSCVDVLLNLDGVDPAKILLFGAVAGGGDPAAVAAALDDRVTVAAIFNFGGPQPESTYPLPANADATFNYAGSGSWESTRNLARSCMDGFLPWVIVGSIAPRRLIYAHEFAWDRDNDPVWARLQRIWSWYDPTNLAGAHGSGKLSGKPPESSHCNNIGRIHRASMAPALKRWFGLEPPICEAEDRRNADQLRCDPSKSRQFKFEPLHRALQSDLGKNRPQGETEQSVREAWRKLLNLEVRREPARVATVESIDHKLFFEERLVLRLESQITVPAIVLRPAAQGRHPFVVAIAHGGKSAFMRHRSAELAGLLQAGIAVVLVDVRGTGETQVGAGRGRSSATTAHASTELMLGRNMLGLQLQDLLAVLAFAKSRKDFDASRFGIWGDSFAVPNANDKSVSVPLDADPQPTVAEPLGASLAILATLFEKDIRCFSANGGLIGYDSILESQFVHVPFDAIVPGVLTVTDLDRAIRAIRSRPGLVSSVIDGRNQLVTKQDVEKRSRSESSQLQIMLERSTAGDFVAWWKKQFAK